MSNKDYVTELSEDLNQIYSHLGVEAFPNQQEEALKIIDGYKERYKKITDLEAKLAEKEEILEWQNEIIEGVKQEEELLAQKLKSLGVDCIEDLSKETNQNKISFAIEQLEKVKNFVDIDFRKNCYIDAVKLDMFIDNQIKQLKEMKNGR